jgi:Glycosyl transferase family 2
MDRLMTVPPLLSSWLRNIRKLLHKPNGGQSSARNFGAANSKGALIALLDQDDVWYPHHLETLFNPFRRERAIPLGWVYSHLDEIDESGGMITRSLLNTMPSHHPKRTLIECLAMDMFILNATSAAALLITTEGHGGRNAEEERGRRHACGRRRQHGRHGFLSATVQSSKEMERPVAMPGLSALFIRLSRRQ